MLKVYVATVDEEIEVDDDGKFELPQRPYTAAELKKIAREVNKAIRDAAFNFD